MNLGEQLVDETAAQWVALKDDLWVDYLVFDLVDWMVALRGGHLVMRRVASLAE